MAVISALRPNSLGDNVVTDLHVNDLEALYSLLKDVDSKAILHVSFDDTNFLYDCGYPANCGAAYIYAHDSSYGEIAHYLQNIFVDPSALSNHAGVTIEDHALCAAGAVVIRDVHAWQRVGGVPARPLGSSHKSLTP